MKISAVIVRRKPAAKFKSKAADYLKIVEWSEADGCFVGSAPPLIGPCCHGDNETEVYRDLCAIVSEWVENLQKDGGPLPPPTAGREYSGKFLLRMSPDLHKALDIRARQTGDSLNSYCIKSLTDKQIARRNRR